MMQPHPFDRPVLIYFGKPGRTRSVNSAFEAEHCLKSEKWPGNRKHAWQQAINVLEALKLGQATPAQARQSFERAAGEAQILASATEIEKLDY
ncbi:DUF982 domain-containing protein [Mesorhizobium sp.]|jgi:hypothetical protein|uniref:DUF982 domain-containing protein n=1 Tax=Mesorhizobium sp. TaxID=1871066 RepID=UPI0039C926B1